MSKIIHQTLTSREKADYLDFFVAFGDEAESQIERAEDFRNVIGKYLMDRKIISAE